ncbi:hypothetical protein AJ80_07371 [Polytolypa hystricis UAMH7299]|uniref:SHSP domain-containing protein n=1 Tax=Polytolypa hystricis (strain UAMH7299) TaxID=1447883 RepID=A0A2B7XPF1_POLH7|nr:hypothetical protein AJ80_07371 [Polytolypa hystricis UAMH7299]
MAFFPSFSNDFTPLFRLLDDYDVHRSSTARTPGQQQQGRACSIRSFTPRFDVRESKDAYHLDGEMPGIDQKDIEIEFADLQTIVIKGRTAREYTSTNVEEQQPQLQVEDAPSSPAPSSPSSHQPTVEDEDAPPQQEQQEIAKPATKSVTKKRKNEPKYWVSERSFGEFHRSFNFPIRVDQENVRANLKNGILSITVPKAAAPTLKKIHVE